MIKFFSKTSYALVVVTCPVTGSVMRLERGGIIEKERLD
jgi:hypothetical protein